MTSDKALPAQKTVEARRTLLRTGIIMGVGLAGTLDEVLFHQLLRWHNFYVNTTLNGRLIADGLFHFFSSLLLLWAAWRIWRQPRFASPKAEGSILGAGVLMGAGGFNLYDGTIQHRLFHLHPVREGVNNLWVYDLTWNAVALVILFIGIAWWWRIKNLRSTPR